MELLDPSYALRVLLDRQYRLRLLGTDRRTQEIPSDRRPSGFHRQDPTEAGFPSPAHSALVSFLSRRSNGAGRRLMVYVPVDRVFWALPMTQILQSEAAGAFGNSATDLITMRGYEASRAMHS